MVWNWQRPDWPSFEWTAARFTKAEERFVLRSGVFLGTVKHLPDEDRDALAVEVMSTEAVTTSEIEGEILSRDSVQSSIRRQLGLDTDRREVEPAEEGIGELMVDLVRRFDRPLDGGTLLEWHRMICKGRTDLRDVGRFRTHAEPMQVVSGRLDKPTVHFEAPPSARVPEEMARFVEWFNRTAPGGRDELPALTRAGVAHLYFECIHPFEDGNGRVGRALAEKALAQSLGRPALTALASAMLERRRSYYDALEAANKGLEITQWLAWFAGLALEAQARTIAHVEFLIDKARLLDRFRAGLNDRQRKVLLRVLREGPAGFRGGLSSAKYVAIARTSPATATRDLAAMVELGALTRRGERRHARYYPPISDRPVPRITIDEAGRVVESPRHIDS